MSDRFADSLQRTVLEFIAELKDSVFTSPEEQGELMLVEFFYKQQHPLSTMNHIVQHVLPHKAQIVKKNKDFFINNTGIFAGLPEDRVSHYTNLIRSGRIDEENIDVMWQYFTIMIKCAEAHKKMK